MKKVLTLLLLLILSCTASARQVTDASVVSVSTHDCCGRGPYTSVILSGGDYSGAAVCDSKYDHYFAIETSHPNHDAFVSIALSSLALNIKVHVFGNRGGCIGPFNRADGLRINK